MDDSSRRLPLRNTRTILRAFGHPRSRKGRTRIIRSSWVANFGPRPMSHHSTTGRLDSGLGALATSMLSSASASRGELAIAQVPPVSTLVTRLGPLATAVIVPCLAQRLVALERCHRLLAGAHVLGRRPSCLNRLLRRALNPIRKLGRIGRALCLTFSAEGVQRRVRRPTQLRRAAGHHGPLDGLRQSADQGLTWWPPLNHVSSHPRTSEPIVANDPRKLGTLWDVHRLSEDRVRVPQSLLVGHEENLSARRILGLNLRCAHISPAVCQSTMHQVKVRHAAELHPRSSRRIICQSQRRIPQSNLKLVPLEPLRQVLFASSANLPRTTVDPGSTRDTNDG